MEVRDEEYYKNLVKNIFFFSIPFIALAAALKNLFFRAQKLEPRKNKGKNLFLFVALFVFSLTLPNNVDAAQDFIIENKSSSLFVVNGTTGNIMLAPAFCNL